MDFVRPKVLKLAHHARHTGNLPPTSPYQRSSSYLDKPETRVEDFVTVGTQLAPGVLLLTICKGVSLSPIGHSCPAAMDDLSHARE